MLIIVGHLITCTYDSTSDVFGVEIRSIVWLTIYIIISVPEPITL